MPDSFANIQDKSEITVIIDQFRIKEGDIIEVEKDWRIITFDMILPFGLAGFLAKISKVLTDENISIFAIFAYSTDHILVKEKDLPRAIKKLENIGCIVQVK
jgi:hypothetical protein